MKSGSGSMGKRLTKHLLDRSWLRRLAGPQSFARGEAYFANGQVHALVQHEGTIAATVSGLVSVV
jgi:uncharacterized Zn finger protein